MGIVLEVSVENHHILFDRSMDYERFLMIRHKRFLRNLLQDLWLLIHTNGIHLKRLSRFLEKTANGNSFQFIDVIL